MRRVYDPYEDRFSTEDVREIELGDRVMSADDWENSESCPFGRTERERENSEAFIIGNAAVAQAIGRTREYENTHPGEETLDQFRQRMVKEVGE